MADEGRQRSPAVATSTKEPQVRGQYSRHQGTFQEVGQSSSLPTHGRHGLPEICQRRRLDSPSVPLGRLVPEIGRPAGTWSDSGDVWRCEATARPWHARGQTCRPAAEWSEAPAVPQTQDHQAQREVAELGGRRKKSDDRELDHDQPTRTPPTPTWASGAHGLRPAVASRVMVGTMPLAISRALPGHPGLARRPPVRHSGGVGSRWAGPGSSCPRWSPRCEVEGDAGLAL